MLKDVVQCYADVLYLKTTLRLPPPRVETAPQQAKDPPCEVPAAAVTSPRRRGLGWLAQHVAAALQLHFERIETSAPLSSKRTFRRIGG